MADEHTDSFQIATTVGNTQWKTSMMTWFILLKTLMGHAQLHARTITPFVWLETIKGWLAVVNTTTATK